MTYLSLVDNDNMLIDLKNWSVKKELFAGTTALGEIFPFLRLILSIT